MACVDESKLFLRELNASQNEDCFQHPKALKTTTNEIVIVKAIIVYDIPNSIFGNKRNATVQVSRENHPFRFHGPTFAEHPLKLRTHCPQNDVNLYSPGLGRVCGPLES